MRKINIVALTIIVLTTNFINEVKAQKQKFHIPLESIKIMELNNSQKKKVKILDSNGIEEKTETQKIENLELERIKAETQKIENEKNKLSQAGFKADHYEIYIRAASKYGIDWHILAAVHKVETGQSGDTFRKSHCGATGPMQFMPPTFKAYGVDGDGDGSVKINDVDDAIFSAANYLTANNARNNIDHALFRYNHSQSYVNKVKSLALMIS